MTNVLKAGVRVVAIRKRRRGGMVAQVDGRWLGLVDKIEPVRQGLGWLTVRIPLDNVTMVDFAEVPDAES